MDTMGQTTMIHVMSEIDVLINMGENTNLKSFCDKA